MPKAIKSGVREMILKVKSFFDAKKEQGAPIIPFDNVNKGIAAATGIGLSTIYKIVEEGKTAAETGTKITTPGQTRRRTCGKIEVDSFDQGVIRRKVHEFYAFKKELPTINKLLKEISGISALDHTYAIGAQCAHTSASLDHNYCVKGFQ